MLEPKHASDVWATLSTNIAYKYIRRWQVPVTDLTHRI